MFSTQNFDAVTSAFSSTTVPFSFSITSSESSDACIATIFVLPLAPKLASSSLSSDGDSGIVITMGGLVGFVVGFLDIKISAY